MKILKIISALSTLAVLSCTSNSPSKEDYSTWNHYAGTKSGVRYSSNTDINHTNISRLKEVWRYSSGDKDPNNRSQNQCNPIVVNGVLYGTSPQSKLLALEAATGKELWVFDPTQLDASIGTDPMRFYKVNRGVAYWENDAKTQRRLFYNVGAHIYAIDADSGQLITSFGEGGTIDLMKNIGRNLENFNPFVASTSPPVIYKNLLISGCRVAESIDAAPGPIRAYHVETGKLVWTFNTIPHPGEVGADSWSDKNAYNQLGGANNWAGMSLDENRGIVYVPLGSVSGDFYGGLRPGENLFGNSLVALDASSGEYIWHFQTVHHDLWDRDLPANPNLFTLEKDGVKRDVVAQISKQGYVFLFDRESGKPIYDIVETPFPTQGLPGEVVWPTQPIPTLPEPFSDQYFSRDEVGGTSAEEHERLLAIYDKVPHRDLFDPPSMEGNWIFPGFDGGGEWGGSAVDVESQILYVSGSRMPWLMEMVSVPSEKTADGKEKSFGNKIYDTYCFACHGIDRQGVGSAYPSLLNIGAKYSNEEISSIIKNGRNMMPGFNVLTVEEQEALIAFLNNSEAKEPMSKEPRSNSIQQPYKMNGYNRFLDKDGYPGIKPPWGTLSALDMKTGKMLWKVPLGNHDELAERGFTNTGTENYGGPLVTKGGLVFIAATKDSKIHAFDKNTGELVWEHDLPAPGYATPATYSINGKQYLVIACGGGKIGSPSGDEYLAFALDDELK